MTTHKLKITRQDAELHLLSRKDWFYLPNDKNYKEADNIEFNIAGTANKFIRTILYVYDVPIFGLTQGYCIISVSNLV